MDEVITLVHAVEEALDDLKGNDIITLDLRKIENSISSFFVICHGTSNTHVSSLADSVEDKVAEQLHDHPLHIEGRNTGEWVIVDYGNVIVHIFQKEQRDFYRLEDFWADGIKTTIA